MTAGNDPIEEVLAMALSILLVDDSATVRALVAKMLHMTRMPIKEIYQARNGREALDLLDDQWVDLILTDLNMPEMDGMEMIQRLHSEGLLESIPVIIISTEGSASRIAELRAKGVKGYLRKPFSPENIRMAVDDALGVRPGPDQKELLEKVFVEVLEKMAYVFAQPTRKDSIPAAEEECSLARMTFTGPMAGTLILAAPSAASREIAANIMGMEPESDMVIDMASDAIKEVLNVTCGHVLTSLAGVRPVFNVTTPDISHLDADAWQEFRDHPRTSGFLIEDRPLLLQLALAE